MGFIRLAASNSPARTLSAGPRYGFVVFNRKQEVSMSKVNESGAMGPAVQTALAYFYAWSNKDIDRTMSHVADTIVCHSPGGRIEGAAAFREFWAGFMKMLTGAQLIASFGDDKSALIMYDTSTVPVAHAPAAEYLTVKDGKITECRIVFDRAPFAEARAKAAQA
jgi:hypothetical protein